MNRKTFLKKSCQMCAATSIFPAILSGQDQTNQKKKKSNVTPDNKKVEFTKKWVKQFFEELDQLVDNRTREKLMVRKGQRCFLEHYTQVKNVKPDPKRLPAFIKKYQTMFGKDAVKQEKNIIYYKYIMNPETGLKISDGYCLCPLVEDGPKGLSPTYCMCSVGYVTEMFKFITGKPVKVSLEDSLHRGGKECRFTIQILG